MGQSVGRQAGRSVAVSFRSAAALLPTAVAAATLIALAPAAWATHVGEVVSVDQQVLVSSDSLIKAFQQWKETPGSAKSNRVAAVTKAAQNRMERLKALLQRNPQAGAARLLPAELRNQFPAEAQPYLERAVKGSGTVYAMVADDFERRKATRTYFFQPDNTPASARLQLHLADGKGGEREMLGWVGRKVTVTGTQLSDQLVVTESNGVVVALDGTNTGAVSTTIGTVAKVSGVQKTLAIVANFQDATVSCTNADVEQRVFGATGVAANANFLQSSRNQVSLSGQVVGPVTIPFSSTGSCDFGAWATAAEAAARAAGVDPSQFARVTFVQPRNANCGWLGLAYMPGRQSWIQNCTSTGTYMHEIAHNFGLHHAGTPGVEYGDSSDPMGYATTVAFNAPNRVMAGWMAPGTVADVTAAGTYAVDALGGAAGTNPQVLRLPKKDTNEYYYLSLRQAVGLDSGLTTAHRDKLSVHKSGTTLPSMTTLVASLAPGQSWTDAANGITLTATTLSGASLGFTVSMAAPVCTRAAPTLTLSPASQSTAPGSARSFTATLKNNDSSSCAASSYSFTPSVPAGFTSAAPASLSVAAGATGSATWTVTPSSTLASGSYGVDLNVADTTSRATSAHGTLSVVATTADTTPPTVSFSSPASGGVVSGRNVTLAAQATDAVGVARVEFYANGQLVATDTAAPYTASWNLRKAVRGSNTLEARAFDAAGNRSSASIVVTY